ncbi:serine hydrolase domain-containing protein [Nonomuraea wenchangensis]|uniref:serine hydrolase domain-containing protein n=1 Tax=Nonomuraea wenchangensis TaxID=568860 RepID=UPI003850B42D
MSHPSTARRRPRHTGRLAVAALAVATAVLPLSALEPASAAQVSVETASALIGADQVRPSDNPVVLRSAPRKLAVTYTHKGEERTLDDFLTATRTNGFVVLDGQDIVLERYVGANRDMRFQSWSMAKSFTSAAIGIALSEGHIRSIDDPVTRYLPELKGSGFDGVSIRNLLRMSSGIEWEETKGAPQLQALAQRGRPLKNFAARQKRGWKPGSRFEYTSVNSFVLARLIGQTTGMPYHRYVQEKIWKPAGMESSVLIGNDSSGDNLGYCCFHATDRDFARFGLLYLRGGKAHGKQVVPASWVRRSTKPSASFNERYGLHWWLGGGGEKDYMAAGFGGQHIYVSPKHDVVIVKSVISTPGGQIDLDEAFTAFRAVAAEVARTRTN